MPRRQNCVRSRGTFLKTEWGRAWTCAHGQKDRLGSDFAQNLASADEAYPVSMNLVGKRKAALDSHIQEIRCCRPIQETLDAKLHTELTAVRDDAFA